MIQKELNEVNREIKILAYELYGKHSFTNGNDYNVWPDPVIFFHHQND